MKILLLEPSESIGELITKNLQRNFDAEVSFFKDVEPAVEELKNNAFTLIIARNTFAGPVLNTIYDLSSKTPLIVIGDFEHAYKKYALVSDHLRLEEVNRLVLKALGLKREDFEHLKLPDYVPFPVKHFYMMTRSPCDIFIKLLKKSGDEYVKRLKQGENFAKEDLKKYEEFGVTDFYILKENYDGFMESLLVQTLNTLKSARSMEEAVDFIGDTFVIGSDLLRTLGITPVCISIVNQTISSMKNQLMASGKLGPLLRKLLEDHLSYSFRHSYLICALSYTLLPKMEWGSGDQQANLLEKICMVSYFHDVYLDDEKLLKINTTDEMKKAKLTSRESDALLNHAHHAATLVQTFPRLPQGVDTIIKQHHGTSNGVGFPEVFTAAISPMAIFFMVVEDFAKQVLALEGTPEQLAQSMREALVPLKQKYQLPSYRKIVTEIENLVTPKK
jgi:HD-GYP domain-containing protein (c-di-GMP phosphodiesterase class II)